MELRADAARNRAAIVEAARTVFAEHGLDAPLDDIARLAGTGNATLYRRFATRGDLIEAVFAERMVEELDAVEAALANPDPWDGFASYVTAVGAMQTRDRGMADLVTMDVARAPEIEAVRARAFKGLVKLVARARTAGVLRDDFTTQDVVLLLMANAGLVERTHDISEQASARLLHVLLDGLRASAATDGPVAPGAPGTEEAMRRNSEHRLGASIRKTKGTKGTKEPVCPQTSPASNAKTSTRSASEKDH
ncbi:TetR/AcrR family transcriptional regulator [Nocardioides sp. 31GB23]|uniref:TetR/AcrR family transcriptional regulator n=1 Tax=Nocardioides sp. 31GB23 TaxID=3156065 RepID=UPI0032B0127F